MVEEVQRERAPALAAEAAHAASDVGREPGPWLFAVVADVDAGRELALDDVADRRLRLALELACVDRLAGVLADEQVAQRGRARDAADVGHQDALVTALHQGTMPAGRGTNGEVAGTARGRDSRGRTTCRNALRAAASEDERGDRSQDPTLPAGPEAGGQLLERGFHRRGS
jgi:hypothetical protein